MEYAFTLHYQLPEHVTDAEACLPLLANAGCDDAAVGIGVPGRIALEFAREAPSADDAVQSALAQLSRAIPGARLLEVAPDYVGLTDAAALVRVTRQNLRQRMVVHSHRFPPPVHQGSTALWHLDDLIPWLRAEGGYHVDPSVAAVAAVARRVNGVIEGERAGGGVSEALRVAVQMAAGA
jgi:hypothetical protein